MMNVVSMKRKLFWVLLVSTFLKVYPHKQTKQFLSFMGKCYQFSNFASSGK